MTAVRVADLVPHAGAMCLLENVIDWRADRIHCRARIESAADHPLGGRDGLPATALIEYAAQAIAAHGTLVARATNGAGTAAAGRLVALRHIDLMATPAEMADARCLDIQAERIMADASGSIYAFRVVSGQQPLARGRLTIRAMGGDD